MTTETRRATPGSFTAKVWPQVQPLDEHNLSHACIAIGARAAASPIPGLPEAGYLTS